MTLESTRPATAYLDTTRHPIADAAYIAVCRDLLERDGALVLHGIATAATVDQVVDQSVDRETDAFYTDKTHNVYLTPADDALSDEHPFNRPVDSSKGLIADDQIPADSPLREIYDDASFRSFLCGVLGIVFLSSSVAHGTPGRRHSRRRLGVRLGGRGPRSRRSRA